MGADESGDRKPRPFKTRKQTIVNGVTVVLSIPLLAFLWGIYKDIREFTRANSTQLDQRIAQLQQQVDAAVAEERARAKEEEQSCKLEVREVRNQVYELYRRLR